MKILLAKHSGACYGVQRALDIAADLLNAETKASTLGPLIHNPQVVAELERNGIAPASSLDDVAGDTVVIRSHGVTPDVQDEALCRGFKIVDATCPHVARAQKAAAEFASKGMRVVVIGESGHPEVESLVGYAKQNGALVDVVSSAADISDDVGSNVGVVVQTTQTEAVLNSVVDALRSKGVNPDVKNTICSATRLRQDAAYELASDCDTMIVIGGRNSSNTTRLYEICSAVCPNTYHIESAAEVSNIDFSASKTVGITAGASTPQSQIDEVISEINVLGL